jgi:translation elongation factor EF-4
MLQPAEPKHFFSRILIRISKSDFRVVNPAAVGSSVRSSFGCHRRHLIAVVVAAGAPVESVLPNVKTAAPTPNAPTVAMIMAIQSNCSGLRV